MAWVSVTARLPPSRIGVGDVDGKLPPPEIGVGVAEALEGVVWAFFGARPRFASLFEGGWMYECESATADFLGVSGCRGTPYTLNSE